MLSELQGRAHYLLEHISFTQMIEKHIPAYVALLLINLIVRSKFHLSFYSCILDFRNYEGIARLYLLHY